MKKWLPRLSAIIMLSTLYISFLVFFSMSFDAADYGWPYSYYHFMTFGRSLIVPILIALAIIFSALVRDRYDDKARKYIDLGILFMIIALIIALSGLFFSLHALSQGGSVQSDSSMYSPLTQSLGAYAVSIASKLLAGVCLIIGVFKEKVH